MLFGIVPVGQVFRSDPWQVIRAGAGGASGIKRFRVRDILLVVQIAICAVLVTSSLVAVRGLMRSLQNSYGFSPQNAILVDTDLHMAGYSPDDFSQMEHRMLDAVSAIPGVTAAGYINQIPLGLGGGDSEVFKDTVTDYRSSNSGATR